MSQQSVNRIKRTGIITALALFLLIIAYIIAYLGSGSSGFPNQALEKAIRQAHPVGSSKLLNKDLRSITRLDLSYSRLNDLEGIELLPNLR
ncbi:MAG: hypothetical protein D6B26_04845, partial [Spirochaetaceae bacterium]